MTAGHRTSCWMPWSQSSDWENNWGPTGGEGGIGARLAVEPKRSSRSPPSHCERNNNKQLPQFPLPAAGRPCCAAGSCASCPRAAPSKDPTMGIPLPAPCPYPSAQDAAPSLQAPVSCWGQAPRLVYTPGRGVVTQGPHTWQARKKGNNINNVGPGFLVARPPRARNVWPLFWAGNGFPARGGGGTFYSGVEKAAPGTVLIRSRWHGTKQPGGRGAG